MVTPQDLNHIQNHPSAVRANDGLLYWGRSSFSVCGQKIILWDVSFEMKNLSGHIFERTKTIPQLTSRQWTNRRVSDIWCHFRHSICQSFFPMWIYYMIQIHSGKLSRPCDEKPVWSLACATSLKLTSLAFKNIMRGQLVRSLVH